MTVKRGYCSSCPSLASTTCISLQVSVPCNFCPCGKGKLWSGKMQMVCRLCSRPHHSLEESKYHWSIWSWKRVSTIITGQSGPGIRSVFQYRRSVCFLKNNVRDYHHLSIWSLIVKKEIPWLSLVNLVPDSEERDSVIITCHSTPWQ